MPFGFYSCTVLPIGVMPATDIFQSRMVSIFVDMGPETPIPDINDIIHLKGATFKLHLDILDKIFQCPSEVQNKMIFMGHQISSCHVPVVRSFFIYFKIISSS
jgi:hypothetical protein